MKSTFLGIICMMICPTIFCQDVKRVVCYVNGSSFLDYFNFPNTTRETPCTHFIYSYAKINADNNSAYLDDSDLQAINILKEFRYAGEHKPFIMVQLGDAEDSDSYSKITSGSSSRQEFIKSIIDIIKSNSLNGAELHWKFPRRKTPPEKLNYVSLAQELNNEISVLMKDHVGLPYQISMTLPALREQIIPGFNLLFLNAVVDFFNLPAYNFTLADRSASTYHHAPLSNTPESNIVDSSVMSLIRLYLRIGLVAQKLVIGVPLFGRLSKGDEILQPEIPNKQVCHMLAEVGWTKGGDSVNGPLFKKDDLVLSVETSNSIEEKARLVNFLRMGGIMFWSYFMDDWNNTCPQNGFPDFQYGSYFPLITATSMIINPDFDHLTTKPDSLSSFENIPDESESQNSKTQISSNKDVTTIMPNGYEGNTKMPLDSSDNNGTFGSVQAFGYSQSNTNSSYKHGSSLSNISTPIFSPYGSVPYSYDSGSTTPSGNVQAPLAHYNGGNNNQNNQFYPSGGQSNPNPNVYYTSNTFPLTKIVEAAKDIVIEETHIQINDNHIYRKI